MIFHYSGEYAGLEDQLPTKALPTSAVPFEEMDGGEDLANFLSKSSFFAMTVMTVLLILCGGIHIIYLAGCFFSWLCVPIHELLHAIWYRYDVYFYHYKKSHLWFVVGTEDMSKLRFLVMCLFPSFVLGIIPFFIFILHPENTLLGSFGAFSIARGVGDFYNIYNTLTQVPKNAIIFCSGMHSYWYLRNS